MNVPAFRRMVSGIIGFVVFAVAYYTPALLESAALPLNDSDAGALLVAASALPEVQLEVARNVLGHVLPLLFGYATVVWIAGKVARTIRLGAVVSRLLFLFFFWLLLLAGNRVLFPMSDYSVHFAEIARPAVAAVAAVVLGGGLLLALVRTLRPRGLLLGVAVGGLLAATVGARAWHPGEQSVSIGARNVVIIGVDSLSLHTMRQAADQLPNLASLLDAATVFERAYTPLGRTFPAWMSLLSGMAPAEHGAIFNLRNLEHVERDSLVTRTLGEAGYRTVFAIDERRFANIDEGFGFDRVVGPKAGALDFVLQRLNDTPLTNLLLQTRVSRHLLPYSHLNVASYSNYDADGFVDDTLGAVAGARRVFLAVHFESAHFPFRTRHASRAIAHPNRFLSRHVGGLTAVDSQVGRLVAGLRDAGFLDDALVVVLSDHGESLGEIEAAVRAADGTSVDLAGYGHGADLLSEHQNRIVLGMVRFRGGVPAGAPAVRGEQVSLTDVRAAVEHFARTGEVALDARDDCMTVETGIRFALASDYRTLDERALASEAAGYYELDAHGRMRLRENRLAELVETKDVGWRCGDRLTYYSPAHARHIAYEIRDGGRRLDEVEARAHDVARIDAYRARLRKAAGG